MSEKTIEKTAPADGAVSDKATEAEEKAAARQASLLRDGWEILRKRPMFYISAFVIVILLALAIAPGLFTSRSPFSDGFCQLQNSLNPPSSGHMFGYDVQGCDIYTRSVFGTRNSIIVVWSPRWRRRRWAVCSASSRVCAAAGSTRSCRV